MLSENTIAPTISTITELISNTRKKTAIIPATEITLSNVATKVSAEWSQLSKLTLLWTTAVEFSELTQSYVAQLAVQSDVKGNRPSLAKRLNEMDNQINDSLDYLKNYISEEVGKDNAQSYFGQFGIQKANKAFRLPADRTERLKALKILLNGITERGYDTYKYGIVFWQPIITEYEAKLTLLEKMDRNSAGQVQPKRNNKEQIILVLNALIHIIKANYPKTYVSELRKWGFQKEKY